MTVDAARTTALTRALGAHRWTPEQHPHKVVLTPPWLVDAIRDEIFDGAIDLDPATTPDNPTGATTFVSPPQDGLLQPWRGRVFLNPPWGATMGRWVHRAIQADASVVLLAPSRTDVAWFQEALNAADDVLFFGRRLDYVRPDSTGRRVRCATGGMMASVLFGFRVSIAPLERFGYRVELRRSA